MTSRRFFAFRILAILAVLYSMGAGSFSLYNLLQEYPPDKPDDVVKWESNMADLKNEIPADQKVIGYVSDWDRRGYDKDVYIEFMLTTYAIAPRLLVRDLEREWIIANSTNSQFFEWLAGQIKHPFTIREFGNGLYLIQQGGQ